jgi:hypothetical protein
MAGFAVEQSQATDFIWEKRMLVSKALRWLTVAGAIAIATTTAVHSVSAQDEDGAAKVKKTAVHASGPVVLAATACPSPAITGNECYTITGSALKQGKETGGTLSGLILTSGTPKTKKNVSCYSILNTSTEILTIGTAVTDIDLGSADACITTNAKKKTSSEAVTPPGAWTSGTGSPETGKGKETWKVTPTDAASTTSPLAGSGTVSLTGTVSP